MVTLWDMRRANHNPLFNLNPQKAETFSVDWNPFNEFIFLTSAADGMTLLWDIRNINSPVHTFVGHRDKCTKVEWSPHLEHIFVSAGDDASLIAWDCSKIGDDTSEGEGVDGPPELIFRHAGHRGIADSKRP